MDPMTTAALISAGSNVLGKAMSAPPSAAQSSAYQNASVDHSGWVIDFGPGSATNAPGLPSWVLGVGIGAAALVGLVWIKKAFK